MSGKKTVFLCTTIKFMGIELDYIKFEIKLSEYKLLRLQKFNNVLKRKRTDTLRELRSLICLLNFACYVIPPGRTFLCRIIDLMKGVKSLITVLG